MKKLAAPVEDYLQSMMWRERSPAFLQVDEKGRLGKWGGSLRNYGIRRVKKGELVGNLVYFLEGLLPLAGDSLILPCVETDPGVFLDIHIFHANQGDWVLLLDAREEAAQRLQLVQPRPETSFPGESEEATFWSQGFQEGVRSCLDDLSGRDESAQVAVLFAGLNRPDAPHFGGVAGASLEAITRPAQFGAEWFATRGGSTAVSVFRGKTRQLPPQKQAVRAAMGMLRVAMSGPAVLADGPLASIGIASGALSDSKAFLEAASKLQSCARSGEIVIDYATFSGLQELQELFAETRQATLIPAFTHLFDPGREWPEDPPD